MKKIKQKIMKKMGKKESKTGLKTFTLKKFGYENFN